jgi:ferredoxin-NADP reductase
VTERPPTDDVAAYERGLRLASLARTEVARDEGLTSILTTVRDRRIRRSIGPGAPPSRVAPGQAGRTEQTLDLESRVRPGLDALPARPAPVLTGPTSGPPGTVLAAAAAGPAIRLLRVGRPPGLTFRAGQYLRLGTGRGPLRKFSIASAPHEPFLEFCIQRIPGGEVTPALFALGSGDRVALGDAPKGRFLLDGGAQRHLMVATGTGIAPLRSMLRDALHRGVAQEVVVLLGASYADELPYHDELTALAASDPRVRYVPTVSRPTEARNAGWSGRTGRVDPLAVEVAAGMGTAGTHVYACGNGGMIAEVRGALGRSGFAISSETF